MGLLEEVAGKRILIDSAPIIYAAERHPVYSIWMDMFLDTAERGGAQLLAATVTLAEVLVLPVKRQEIAEIAQFTRLLEDETLFRLIDLSSETAKHAAYLRARYNLETPDAIQVATAIEHADLFLTNDKKLNRIAEVEVWVVSERAAR